MTGENPIKNLFRKNLFHKGLRSKKTGRRHGNPEGCSEISRGLSAATPPDPDALNIHPEGVAES